MDSKQLTFSETVKYQIKRKSISKIGLVSLCFLVLFTVLYFAIFAIKLNKEADVILSQFLTEQKFADSTSDDLNTKVIKMCNSFDCISTFILDTKSGEIKMSYPSQIDKNSSVFLKGNASDYWFGSLFVFSFNQYLVKYDRGGVQAYVLISMTKYFQLVLVFFSVFLIIIVAFYLTAGNIAKEVSALLNEEIQKLVMLTKGTSTDVSPVTKEISFLYDHITQQTKLATIGQTTAMLAHDIRRPFSQIKGLLFILDQIKDEPGSIDKSMKEINSSIKHVESMLSDIMDFSKEIVLNIEPVSIASLIDLSKHQLSQLADKKEIIFKYTLSNTHKVMADYVRLSRVVSNIISNAIEAIEEKGTIIFSCSDVMVDRHKKVQIIISNNGPLIPEPDLSRVFDLFFTKNKTRGTGLGLASSQKIVSLHGGTITAQNNLSDKVVEFVIVLPASEEKEICSPKNLIKEGS